MLVLSLWGHADALHETPSRRRVMTDKKKHAFWHVFIGTPRIQAYETSVDWFTLLRMDWSPLLIVSMHFTRLYVVSFWMKESQFQCISQLNPCFDVVCINWFCQRISTLGHGPRILAEVPDDVPRFWAALNVVREIFYRWSYTIQMGNSSFRLRIFSLLVQTNWTDCYWQSFMCGMISKLF